METFEVVCEPIPETAHIIRFSSYENAKLEAKRICETYHIAVTVVRVIGVYQPEPRWISYGVPGNE